MQGAGAWCDYCDHYVSGFFGCKDKTKICAECVLKKRESKNES